MRYGHENVVVLSDLLDFTLPFFELHFVRERNYYFNDALIVICWKTDNFQIVKLGMLDTELLLQSLGKRLFCLRIGRTHLVTIFQISIKVNRQNQLNKGGEQVVNSQREDDKK